MAGPKDVSRWHETGRLLGGRCELEVPPLSPQAPVLCVTLSFYLLINKSPFSGVICFFWVLGKGAVEMGGEVPLEGILEWFHACRSNCPSTS